MASTYRPSPVGQGLNPISIVKASSDPLGCPVFGEPIDIITTSPRPITAIKIHYRMNATRAVVATEDSKKSYKPSAADETANIE